MLEVRHLECIRDNQVLFSKLNFSLQPGEIWHVVGANGSGKSSLLQILVGMLLPQQGQVCWDGVVIAANENYTAQLAYIGHKIGVKNSLTVWENLRLAVSLSYARPQLDWQEILRYFDLHALKDVLCEKLSAGQRQRVALTRLLTTNALLWILDEPFTAIDQHGTAVLQQLLFAHTQRGGMVVCTSHQSLQLSGVAVKKLEL